MTHPQIPWHMGDVRAEDVQPDTEAPITLAPGRWTLHKTSTVPFVELLVAQNGKRLVTWGDVFEVPDGFTARVINASAHAGDITFAAIGTGLGSCPRPPSCVTIPAEFTVVGEAMAALYTSRWIDTRTARRCFLVLPGFQSGSMSWFITHRAPHRGRPYGANTSAVITTAPLLLNTRAMVTYNRVVPMGIGCGDNLDPASAAPEPTVQELRPHALLDALQVSGGVAAADALGFLAAEDPDVYINAFFVLEY